MKPARIHRTALGGYTIDGPYYVRRRSRIPSLADRFFYWLGA